MIALEKGAIVVGKSGKQLEVIEVDGEKVLVRSGNDLLRVDRAKILHVIAPPTRQLPPAQIFHIGDRVKLTVTVDKRIDGQVGKVVAVVGPTIRRVKWQLWEEAIERNFQLSYLQEVAA
jgi:hypothetical protein